MYKCRYFKIHELVPQELFEKHGEKCWSLMDDRALKTLDALRERFGSLTVNSYKWGGNRKWSGLRTAGFYKSQSAYDKSRSQHKYGRAIDFISKRHTAKEMRDYVLDNLEEFPHIKFLECEISWFHFDVRNCDFTMWSPKRGVVTSE